MRRLQSLLSAMAGLLASVSLHALSIDPIAEKYSGISPYAYCGGEPVSFIEPDGMHLLFCSCPVSFSQCRLEYVVKDKSFPELTGKSFLEATESYFAGMIEDTELKDVCMTEFSGYDSMDCSHVSLKLTGYYPSTYNSIDCAIGTIESGYYADYNVAFYIFCFRNETIIVDRNAEYSSYFLDIPIGIVSLFDEYAKKNGVPWIIRNEYMLYMLSGFMAENRWIWHHPEGPPAYQGLKYQNGRFYEEDHDFSILKSFLYDHYVLGASSDYLMSSILDFVEYSRQHSNEDKETLEKNIMYDLVELATIANPPSVAQRMEYHRDLFRKASDIMPDGKILDGQSIMNEL